VLKNVPETMKRHTVRGMMEKFGDITRVDVIESAGGQKLVFIDFTTFV
jgi:hypothetical protein